MPVISPNSVSILPATQRTGGSLKEKGIGLRNATQGRPDADLWSVAGEGFAQAESRINHIENALRAAVPQPQVIQITDPNGALVAEIGNLTGSDNASYPGVWGRNLYVGGTGPNNAPFFANGQEVFVGNGGQIFVVDTSNNVGAWLGYQQEAPKAVTGAVNNGSGNVRLTVVGHGYVNGDNALIQGVGGVPGANQSMGIVSVVNANQFDLVGSVFSGAYTSGGTSARFFSGALFAAMAIGGSKVLTNIADNGAGLIRITVPNHGYSTGYAVIVTDTTGIPNLNYTSWLITVIDANNFDLVGSVFSGAYDGAGGQVLNWPTAKLRAYDDGSVVIDGATITLDANGITTIISNGPVSGPGGTPASSITSIDDATGALSYMDPFDFVILNDQGRAVFKANNTAGTGTAGVFTGSGVALHDGFVVMDGNALNLTAYSGGAFGHHQGVLDHTSLDFSQTTGTLLGANYAQSGMTLTNAAGTTTVTISQTNVDSPAYSVAGVPGINFTSAFGTSVTVGTGSFGVSLTVNTGSAVTNVTGVPGLVVSSGSFVTGVTLNVGTGVTSVALNTSANTWTKGLLTA